MQIYLIFYTNLLFLIKNYPFPSQKLKSKIFIIITDKKHKVYVKRILDSKNK